jgi:oligo-1,6-glucosidase
LLFVDEDRNELQMFYHFDHTGVGVDKNNFMYSDESNWDFVEWKKIFHTWDQVFAKKGWGTMYLGNHDMSRMVSRFGNDSETYRALSAKMLHTFILSMRATPYIYNGDEIGMVNTNHTRIEQYQDVYTINYYNQLKEKGEDHEAFLNSHSKISRDNGRTPMQWNNQYQAGFTSATPWLAVNENYTSINVEAQASRSDSVLEYFKAMVQVRKKHQTLIYGAYTPIDETNKQLFAYTRSLGDEQFLVVLNFSNQSATLNTKIQTNQQNIIISNYHQPTQNNVYMPYAAVIYKIEK